MSDKIEKVTILFCAVILLAAVGYRMRLEYKIHHLAYYQVQKSKQVGPYLVVKVKLPVGDDVRIMVYEGVEVGEFESMGMDKFRSPIAQFENTQRGWVLATDFCGFIIEKHN